MHIPEKTDIQISFNSILFSPGKLILRFLSRVPVTYMQGVHKFFFTDRDIRGYLGLCAPVRGIRQHDITVSIRNILQHTKWKPFYPALFFAILVGHTICHEIIHADRDFKKRRAKAKKEEETIANTEGRQLLFSVLNRLYWYHPGYWLFRFWTSNHRFLNNYESILYHRPGIMAFRLFFLSALGMFFILMALLRQLPIGDPVSLTAFLIQSGFGLALILDLSGFAVFLTSILFCGFRLWTFLQVPDAITVTHIASPLAVLWVGLSDLKYFRVFRQLRG